MERSGKRAANARKERMKARCERLEAVVWWTLLGLGYESERALRTARDLVRNALPFAKWVGELMGYDYLNSRFG